MNIAAYECVCVSALVGENLFVSTCMLVHPCLYMHLHCCFSVDVYVLLYFGVSVLVCPF